ncbi:MAG: hypothetical protein IT454_21690 [Planctomycetes bacterium]|nr:hypothetical protein [Planctomycetota bacterium]
MKPVLLALLALIVTACQGTRTLADPVLEIRGEESSELGVATDYGLVFLGRSARSGTVEVSAWFGDGPSVEQVAVEPLGGGLFTAEPEIRFPRVPISFQTPPPGSKLLAIGRVGRERWQAEVEVALDPAIEGLITSVPPEVVANDGQVGAGLYVVDSEDDHKLHLVGLVSGRVEVGDGTGSVRRYLTVVGPDQLWRLVTYRRDLPHKRKFVYRDDIL